MSRNYIEYDLSKIKNYKGGYIVDKDPLNETQKSRFNQVIKQDIIFEPAISLDQSKNIKCKECESVELDFKFLEIFNARVCYKCKKALPDKYSLLTKTECKEDYLLTNSELHDKEILPHMRKSNPRKPEWSTMMLFLRYQVEEFAWKKWGGPEKLDKEWQRRLEEKKLRKDKRLQKKIQELKKHTRTTQYIEKIRRKQTKHIHNFSLPIIDSSTGLTIKKCSCGFETEEILI
ncbi:DNA repair protein [Pneumocystis carinii B80]|uniref:DNA repair protein n=1 Tax=Pneumocystis carinii (strain B80) TaxID=1408658 RepID=A0A0W4ZDY0_PNEC8|nr:DNA repair protein [Pneumocystis carinii B80]KTW26601.1 DNA repair protein [Pneumocystis carinii B80]